MIINPSIPVSNATSQFHWPTLVYHQNYSTIIIGPTVDIGSVPNDCHWAHSKHSEALYWIDSGPTLLYQQSSAMIIDTSIHIGSVQSISLGPQQSIVEVSELS